MKRPFHSILFLLLAVSVRATPLNAAGVQVSNRQYGTPAALRIYPAGFAAPAGTPIPAGAANPVAYAQNDQAVIVSPASDYASPTKAQQNTGKLRAGFAHVKGVAAHTATPLTWATWWRAPAI